MDDGIKDYSKPESAKKAKASDVWPDDPIKGATEAISDSTKSKRPKSARRASVSSKKSNRKSVVEDGEPGDPEEDESLVDKTNSADKKRRSSSGTSKKRKDGVVYDGPKPLLESQYSEPIIDYHAAQLDRAEHGARIAKPSDEWPDDPLADRKSKPSSRPRSIRSTKSSKSKKAVEAGAAAGAGAAVARAAKGRDESDEEPMREKRSKGKKDRTATKGRKGEALSSEDSSETDSEDETTRSVRSTPRTNGVAGVVNGNTKRAIIGDSDDEDERRDVVADELPRSPRAGSAPLQRVRSSDSRQSDASSTSSLLLLSPQDRHYLNKALVCLEMQKEWSALSKIGQLTVYGEPFLDVPNGPRSKPQGDSSSSKGGLLRFKSNTSGKQEPGWEGFQWSPEDVVDSPVLSYMFWRFIYNLPALREAKREFWTDRIQPFFDSFAERDLSTTSERSEVTKRRMLSMAFTRILSTYYSTCVTAKGPSAPARPSVGIMRRIDQLVPGSMESMWFTQFPQDTAPGYNAWTAILGTERGKNGVVYQLITKVMVGKPTPPYFVLRSWNRFKKFADALDEIDPTHTLDLPVLPLPKEEDGHPSLLSLQRWVRNLVISLSAPPPKISERILTEARQELEAFLIGSPEDLPTREVEELYQEGLDKDRKLDRAREGWVKAGSRAKRLRTTWALYRDALITTNEMDKTIAMLRKTPKYKDLPETYQNAEEFACIWVAYALHYALIKAPNAAELLSLLKSFHSLIPYGALKLGLQIVNPTLAIKTVVNIVLGQPAGQPSLFQRIFAIICNGGIKTQNKIIANLREKIGDDRLCDGLERHVYGSFQSRADTRLRAQEDGEDILLTIIREQVSDSAYKVVRKWHKDFVKRGLTSDNPLNQETDGTDAGQYQSLKNLLTAYCCKRDREQVIAIVNERNTPLMLRSAISVFYDVIYQVAENSKLADRLGDLQAFLDDLIKTAYSDKNDVCDFIKCCRRHDQQLYFFVWELATNDPKLMDPFWEWCRSGLEFIRAGVPSTSKRKSTASTRAGKSGPGPNRAGVDYDDLLSRETPETQQAVLTEIRGLTLWAAYKKAYSDISLRCDLLGSVSDERLDKAGLYTELLSQDRQALAYIDARREAGGEAPEDAIDWAFFADDDVLNDPTSIKVDWKAAQKAERELAEARRKEKAKKGLFRRKSGETSRSTATDDDKTLDQGLKIPPPRLRATKVLLDGYVRSVGRDLSAAQEARIR